MANTQASVESNLLWHIAKTAGVGLKVDIATPTFPWQDILGEVTDEGSGGVKPSSNTFIGNIPSWQFGVNDEIINKYHIPHDLVPDSNLFLHFHWAVNVGTVTSGGVTWSAEVTYAKGHDQEPFSAPITTSIQQDASTTQYQHMLAEVELSSLTPSGSQVDSALIEPDGVFMIRTWLSGNTMNGTPEPFLQYVDIHYQSTNIGTKDKAPNFYT